MTNEDTGAAVEDARRGVWTGISDFHFETFHEDAEGPIDGDGCEQCEAMVGYLATLDAAIRADERRQMMGLWSAHHTAITDLVAERDRYRADAERLAEALRRIPHEYGIADAALTAHEAAQGPLERAEKAP